MKTQDQATELNCKINIGILEGEKGFESFKEKLSFD